MNRDEAAAYARGAVFVAIGAIPFAALGWLVSWWLAAGALVAGAVAAWWLIVRWPDRWRPW